jgi:hypothetical protein
MNTIAVSDRLCKRGRTGEAKDITANDGDFERRFCGVLVALIWGITSLVIVFAI